MQSLYCFLQREVATRKKITIFLIVYAWIWLFIGWAFAAQYPINCLHADESRIVYNLILPPFFAGLLLLKSRITVLTLRIAWESLGFGFAFGIYRRYFEIYGFHFEHIVLLFLAAIHTAFLLGLLLWFCVALLSHTFTDQTKAGRSWFFSNLFFLIGAETAIHFLYQYLLSLF